MQELGRDLGQTLYHYTMFVKPAFEEFCLPVTTLSFLACDNLEILLT